MERDFVEDVTAKGNNKREGTCRGEAEIRWMDGWMDEHRDGAGRQRQTETDKTVRQPFLPFFLLLLLLLLLLRAYA